MVPTNSTNCEKRERVGNVKNGGISFGTFLSLRGKIKLGANPMKDILSLKSLN